MSRCPHCQQAIDCSGLSGVVECPLCRKRINCGPVRATPEVVASLPESAHAQPNPLDFVTEAPIPSSRRFINKKNPSTLWGFIDLGFQHYLTPVIIKIVWALSLGLAILGLAWAGLSVISTVVPESRQSRSSEWDSPSRSSPFSPPSASQQNATFVAHEVVAWLALLVSTAICLLILRVICESIIVLFNIAESLSSIDKKTKAV
jgi:hypothetical protein